jgi:hypothetical protein
MPALSDGVGETEVAIAEHTSEEVIEVTEFEVFLRKE